MAFIEQRALISMTSSDRTRRRLWRKDGSLGLESGKVIRTDWPQVTEPDRYSTRGL